MTKDQLVIDRLYKAVQKYVENNGGKLVVIGGIQIQQWPSDLPMNFTVGIRCTGKMPEFKSKKGAKR